jgi:hypothetical protein
MIFRRDRCLVPAVYHRVRSSSDERSESRDRDDHFNVLWQVVGTHDTREPRLLLLRDFLVISVFQASAEADTLKPSLRTNAINIFNAENIWTYQLNGKFSNQQPTMYRIT